MKNFLFFCLGFSFLIVSLSVGYYFLFYIPGQKQLEYESDKYISDKLSQCQWQASNASQNREFFGSFQGRNAWEKDFVERCLREEGLLAE